MAESLQKYPYALVFRKNSGIFTEAKNLCFNKIEFKMGSGERKGERERRGRDEYEKAVNYVVCF